MTNSQHRLARISDILGNIDVKLQAQVQSDERDAQKVLIGEAMQYVAYDEDNEPVITFFFSKGQCIITRNYPKGRMRQMKVDFDDVSFKCTCTSFMGSNSDEMVFYILINKTPSKEELIKALRTLDLPALPTDFPWS